ncbi:MAG TPA: class I SAM-dependent methyltransferase [Candidatus Acidoferrales bacterium]|nr:class I SAM-dependent methyltransferase [Candidatus Acidoferrales bacterium]
MRSSLQLKTNATYFIEKLNHEKEVGNIILKYQSVEKNHDTYIRRWRENRLALYPSYWKNHFHVPTILQAKCITGKILDFGCGTGHIDVILAKKGLNIYGIDISPTAIEIANYYRDHLKQSVKNRLHFHLANINSYYPDFKFDSCLLTDVLEHLSLETAKNIVIELKRLLAKDAPIFISVPYETNYFDPDHCNFFYSVEEFSAFCTAIGVKVKSSTIDTRWKVINSIITIPNEQFAPLLTTHQKKFCEKILLQKF